MQQASILGDGKGGEFPDAGFLNCKGQGEQSKEKGTEIEQDLSFSTCWNAARHSSGRAVAEEIMELGFRRIELSHGLNAAMVQDFLRSKEELGFEVSSLHCFCPHPPEIRGDNPDCYEFTSDSPERRNRAIKLAIQTVEMAARFGAPCVVIHGGRIRSLDATKRLRQMVLEGKLLGKDYAAEKLQAVVKREAAGPKYLKRTLDALQKIAAHAGQHGIILCIENRDDYEAVPSEREMEVLFRRLGAPNVGYWHDFGHAQLKHNMGLLNHAQWLEAMGDRAVGCHVHDVEWPFGDHQAPFRGEVAFEKLVLSLPRHIQYVFEISPAVEASAIRDAAARWRELFLKR